MTIWKHGLRNINQTSKMCFVIITQHNWLFLEKDSCFASRIFAQLQAMKTSETCKAYTTPMGEPKNEQEFLEKYYRTLL